MTPRDDEINGGFRTPAPLLDRTIIELARTLGEMPPGDVPAAWYMSLTEEVLSAYAQFAEDQRNWVDLFQDMLQVSGLPPVKIRYSGLGGDYLSGLIPPEGMTTPPRWWRLDKDGLLVPRKRTRAEKDSEVNKAWDRLRAIPRAIDYLPGMPNTLWTQRGAYHPVVRRPAQAVCVFLAVDPLQAIEPFEVGPHWTQMKLSTFHLLRERTEAAKALREQRLASVSAPAGGAPTEPVEK